MATGQEIEALADAMEQLLDDMGASGQCVCLAAKAQARIAFEPWMDKDCASFFMSLDEAKRIRDML